MKALIGMLPLPFMLLNVLGGLAGFIWLAILGQWNAIAYGIAAIVVMPVLFPYADLPNFGLGYLCIWLMRKGHRVAALPFAVLASFWTSLLVVAWTSLVFFHVSRGSGPENIIPLLLWGYCVAMSPLQYMAQLEINNQFTAYYVTIAMAVYLRLAVYAVFGQSIQAVAGFVLIMTLVMPSLTLLMALITLPRRTR